MGLRRRRSGSSAGPTGHRGDDRLLAQLGMRADLDEPRHWIHYLYCHDEGDALRAAEEIRSAGWDLQRVAASRDGSGWMIAAEQREVVTPEVVSAARGFFESVAARLDGGEYDGWEAGV